MVNVSANSRPSRDGAAPSGSELARGRASIRLVNCGHDTEITLDDGSTLLFKGITEIEAVFPATSAVSGQHPPPIGGEIGDDGK
jgi:hypothetical protein